MEEMHFIPDLLTSLNLLPLLPNTRTINSLDLYDLTLLICGRSVTDTLNNNLFATLDKSGGCPLMVMVRI